MDSHAHTALASGQTPTTPKRAIRPDSKLAGVLRTLLERGQNGMNCFESVRWCHDYTLRSTISSLRRLYGFTFHKKDESRPGHMGSTVHCVRYSLTPDDQELARALLDEGAQ